MENKMTKSQFVDLATKIIGVVALLLLAFGQLQSDAPAEDGATARGTTNMDTLVLSQDLTVTDDATIGDDTAVTGDLTVGGTLDITGATTFGSGNLSPLLTADSNEAVFTTSYTFTGTKVITSSLHGMATGVTSAFCTLGETPATGAGDGALCWVGIGATKNVTVTVEQDDWTTNAANSTKVYVAIVGTP